MDAEKWDKKKLSIFFYLFINSINIILTNTKTHKKHTQKQGGYSFLNVLNYYLSKYDAIQLLNDYMHVKSCHFKRMIEQTRPNPLS